MKKVSDIAYFLIKSIVGREYAYLMIIKYFESKLIILN